MSATPQNSSVESSDKKSFLRLAGPGLLLAATGLGVSDVVTGTVAGANYGVVLLWAILVGAAFKYVLSEGIARWQLAMGTTLLEGWAVFLPAWAFWYFGLYLLLWTVVSSAALASAAGLGLENLTHGAIPQSWGGILHSLLGGALVFASGYVGFAKLMKLLAAVMLGTICVCAGLTLDAPAAALSGMLMPTVPLGAGSTVLSLISGVGGSIPMLCYCYWMREEKLSKPHQLAYVRGDIALAYIFTALFGIAIALIANQSFFVRHQPLSDAGTAAGMAAELEELTGSLGRWVYSIGFWAVVSAALVGVWQSVPYLYADFFSIIKKLPPEAREQTIQVTSKPYRAALLFITLLPLPFAFTGRPDAIILLYTIFNSAFIPFLVVTLLYMNNHIRWHNTVPRYSWISNTALVVILVLFVIMGLQEIGSAGS